jgi:Uma2 family endonuclease
MTVAIERRLFTVDDFYRMLDAGILTEDDRVELIEGEIIEMAPTGSSHAARVDRLTRCFAPLLTKGAAIVRVQGPVRLSYRTEPLPDLALLRPRDDYYADAHPGPTDVLLLVEVAETSAAYDRRTKMPLYAHAGIPEAWIVLPTERRIEVYRQPTAKGYAETRVLHPDESISPSAFPDLNIAAADILG